MSAERANRILSHIGMSPVNISSSLSVHPTSESSGSAKRGDIAKVEIADEEYQFKSELEQEKIRWKNPRWKHTNRPYTPEEVIRLRSPQTREYAGSAPATKLSNMLRNLHSEGKFSHTFGKLIHPTKPRINFVVF